MRTPASSSYIRNNTSAKAMLKNGADATLDTCSWGGGSASVYR